MKQEFEMTQSEMNGIIAINKHQSPVMKIGSYVSGLDLQENINNYWFELGNKYGFKPLTVEPSAKGKLFFLAEPKPIVVPKTTTEIKIDEYILETRGYVSLHVKNSLVKIIKQLESCEYECEGGLMKQNIAFLALKKLASQEI